MSESNYKWYVLKVLSGKEYKVKDSIEKACKTTNLGKYVSQVLVPTEKATHLRNGKRQVKERLHLPGYVLVECNLVDECYPLLRNLTGVLGFLSGDRTIPTPVHQWEINRLMGNVDDAELSETEEFPYLVGESVKVTDGPFSGFRGVINEILTDKKKLKVEVTIFGRKSPLELSFNQVDKE